VNCDGKLSIGDVTTLISYLLGSEPLPFDILAADVNQDDKISIGDVTQLINLLLTGNAAMTSWYALPSTGGIKVENPMAETLEVYDLNANVVATVHGGDFIQLPRGTYIVASTTRSRKVIVK
jgi:hypothetical protein